MKIIITLLLALMPLNFALSQEEGKRPAHVLLNLLNVEQVMLETSKVAFSPFLKQFKGQGYSDAAVKEVSEAADAYFGQVSSDPDLKDEMAKMYEKSLYGRGFEASYRFLQEPRGPEIIKTYAKLNPRGRQDG